MSVSRRSLITGLVSFVAAPAIVRASSLMPVKRTLSFEELLAERINEAYAVVARDINRNLYGDLVDVTRKVFVPRLFVNVTRTAPIRFSLVSDRHLWADT